MKTQAVSLVRGPDRYANVRESLELIRADLAGIQDKQNILIKPNLTATINPYANTHVKAVEAVLDFLLEKFPRLKESRWTILEGSGSAHYEKKTTREVFEKFGYLELAKKYRNVKIECVEDFPDFYEMDIASIAGREKIKIIKHFFDFDYRISVAVPKSHNYAIATFGIKNMAGLIKQSDKSLLHGLRTPSAPDSRNIFTYIPTSAISWMRRRVPKLVNFIFKKSSAYLKAVRVIHFNVADFAKVCWPDLVVLDGAYFMDGNGPVDGFPVKKDLAISSGDALKADGLAARLMGLAPRDIGYLYYLKEQGLGDYSLDGLVGGKITKADTAFKMHPTYRIQKEWKVGTAYYAVPTKK